MTYFQVPSGWRRTNSQVVPARSVGAPSGPVIPVIRNARQVAGVERGAEPLVDLLRRVG
jgi:hypothetical protein